MEETSQFKIKEFFGNFSNLLLLTFSIYLFYLIGHLILNNYHINQQTDKLSDEVEILEMDNFNQKEYLAYYKSESFKEIELRKRLLLKKPGETAVMLPIRKDEETSFLQTRQYLEILNEKPVLPNYRKWIDLFFADK
jgi:hypothetical protein